MTRAAGRPDVEEKALIFFSSHGSYRDRTVAFADTDDGQPGGGRLITSNDPTPGIFAGPPELLVGLREELPRSGGGFWADDPLLQREGQPYLGSSTSEELFASTTSVGVLLNGLPIGALALGNPGGSGYRLDIPDAVLDAIMSDIVASGGIDAGFLRHQPLRQH